MPLNCGAEDCWKSLGQQEDQISQSWRKSIPNSGRTDAEAEAPVFWSSDVNSWFIGKVPDAGEDWGQKEKRASEDEMTGWHHQCNGHERGQTSGDGDGLGALVCCSLWGHKESDMTGWLNNNADDTTLMAESGEELKSLLMRVKKESERTDLKTIFKKTKTMASGPITSWQIEGKRWK